MLYSPVQYPIDYGFFLDTLASDGDPLNALVLVNETTFPECLIELEPVVVCMMRKEKMKISYGFHCVTPHQIILKVSLMFHRTY